MRKIDDDTWIKVETDYQMGIGIRQLERTYDIPASTINSRKKKFEWTQKSHAKVIELTSAVANIAQDFAQEQLPYVQDKLNEILQLQIKVNSFVKKAIDINLKNLYDAEKEPDPIKRIRMIAMMKATMPEVAGICKTPPAVVEIDNPEDDDRVINLIME